MKRASSRAHAGGAYGGRPRRLTARAQSRRSGTRRGGGVTWLISSFNRAVSGIVRVSSTCCTTCMEVLRRSAMAHGSQGAGEPCESGELPLLLAPSCLLLPGQCPYRCVGF
jgi:hypothetical protein